MSSLGDLYTHLKTLCEQWFYNKSQMDTALNGKINKSNTVGLVKNDGSIDTTNYSTFDGNYNSLSNKPSIPTKTSDLTNDGDGTNVFVKNNDSRLSNARTPTAHNQASSTITDSHTYTNIGNVTGTQESINSAIDTKLGQLSGIDAINVVSTLPTASSSTMGKLYIIEENSKINVYYTEQDGNSYEWHKMDTDILDDLSIGWSDIQNNPFSSASPSNYATSTHSHGIINNAGEITDYPRSMSVGDSILFCDNTGDNPTGEIKVTESIPANCVKDPNSHGRIGTNANALQSDINTAIDTQLNEKENKNSKVTSVTSWNSPPRDSYYPSEKLVKDSLDLKLDIANAPTDLSDLTDTNNLIPSDVSDLTDTNNTQFTPKSHAHGQITNDGKITSTAVSVASGDNILITDTSDSNKVKRVANLLAEHIKDGTAHSNIGSSANETQASINTKINTALSNKANVSELGSVAFSNSYDDLTDKPNIPQGVVVDTTLSSSSNNAIANSTVTTALNGKVDTNDSRLSDARTPTSHTHGYVQNGGTLTQTGVNNGSIVVTNSSNKLVIESSIDVLDDLIQDLITYGSS